MQSGTSYSESLGFNKKEKIMTTEICGIFYGIIYIICLWVTLKREDIFFGLLSSLVIVLALPVSATVLTHIFGG